VCTACKIRIPQKHEALIPIKTPCGAGFDACITEALPQTSKSGLSVADVLVSRSVSTSMCHIMNPTSRSITWKTGHAVAYFTPFEVSAVDENLVRHDRCMNVQKTPHTQTTNAISNGGACRVKGRDTEQAKPELPDHREWEAELHRLGVKVGTDGLSPTQYEKLTAVLYRARDIMAENVTQVQEARVPRHTILLKDTKLAICKQFRYDPTKEQKVESLCDDLLNAGIINN